MKRSFPVLALLLFLCQVLPAQNPSRVTIKGSGIDSLQNELAYATVMLLNVTDTTLENFTRSDEKGNFSFKNIRNKPYLLKISYIEPYSSGIHIRKKLS